MLSSVWMQILSLLYKLVLISKDLILRRIFFCDIAKGWWKKLETCISYRNIIKFMYNIEA